MGDNWPSSGLRASSGSVPDFHFSADGRVLQTVGILVDTIKEKTTRTIWQPSRDPVLVEDGDFVNLEWGFEQTVQAYREWYALHEKHFYSLRATYGSYEGVMDALGKVLTLRLQSCFSPATMSAWTYLINKKQDRSRAFLEATSRLQLRKGFEKHPNSLWFRMLMRRPSEEEWQTLCALKMCPETSTLNHAIWMHNADRSLFVTEGGFLGSANMSIREGDAICLLSGVDRPMILRAQGQDSNSWTIVCPAYIDGMMEGQLWDSLGLRSVSIV